MSAGLFSGLPFADYAAIDAVSNSQLAKLHKSPKHLRAYLDEGDVDRPHLILGRAVHCAVLEPDVWETGYMRGPEGDGRTKKVKDEFTALREEHPHAVVLRASDFDLCLTLRAAVMAHRGARYCFTAPGESEVSAVWEDKETGLLCKGRFDRLARKGVLIDLKTTRDGSPDAFRRSIWEYGYHRQAAMYLNGAAALGLDVQRFILVAVEKEPPYAVGIYEVDAGSVDAGNQQVRALLRRFKECKETDTWPGYSDDAVPLSLPAWAWDTIEGGVGS